jgi:glycolate oxidase FAD binding subunit
MDAGVSPHPAHDIAAFEHLVRAIVGAEYVRPAVAADCVAGKQPQLVVEPGSAQDLAKILKLANDTSLSVIPRGGGTKLAWGNPPLHADVILSAVRLDAIVEYASSDLTVTLEAGCTIKQLREILAHIGQRLAIDVLWPSRATVGGILSTNDSGALRLRFGSLRDLIIGVTLALPDGTLAKSGGKVVKNVAGYDLAKLVTGALGTLGIITSATFRLHPLPKESQTISYLARDVNEAQERVLAIQDSKLAHSALQVRFVESLQPQIDVLFEATRAGLAAQVDQLKSILASSAVIDPGPAVWNARQELYSAATDDQATSALAKISILPAQIAQAHKTLAMVAVDRMRFSAVIQATGIGAVLLKGTPAVLADALKLLRANFESIGGSLVVAHRPAAMPALDAWGDPGDAVELMRAVRRQLDPKSTLNPGRFVAGI